MTSRSYRKRKKSSSSNSDVDSAELPQKVSGIKDVQKIRCKRGGINAISLAVGRIVSNEEVLSGKVFGHSSSTKSSENSDERYGLQVGNTFYAESNQKEEDHIMHRYIEDELAKRRGNFIYKYIFI